ncbi:MAG: mechanosensitive ion channel family protein [Desulfobacter sp.]|nr:MAG: mechanosensitive ion channel family protein [Desulfobacter sp.]
MGAFQDIYNELFLAIKKLFQPEVIIGILNNALVIIFIVFVSLLVLKLVKGALKKLEVRQLPLPFLQQMQSMVKWVICIGAFLLILQQLGIKINSLWAVASTILAMVAIGFVALWSVLSNLLCTLMLIIFHPFRIGDNIEIIDPAMTIGVGGKVRNINLIFTTLDASDGDAQTTIQVPNNLFFHKILRKKKGQQTHSLEKQVFEEKSLLRSQEDDPKNKPE